jgi:hypothetical protein
MSDLHSCSSEAISVWRIFLALKKWTTQLVDVGKGNIVPRTGRGGP